MIGQFRHLTSDSVWRAVLVTLTGHHVHLGMIPSKPYFLWFFGKEPAWSIHHWSKPLTEPARLQNRLPNEASVEEGKTNEFRQANFICNTKLYRAVNSLFPDRLCIYLSDAIDHSLTSLIYRTVEFYSNLPGKIGWVRFWVVQCPQCNIRSTLIDGLVG